MEGDQFNDIVVQQSSFECSSLAACKFSVIVVHILLVQLICQQCKVVFSAKADNIVKIFSAQCIASWVSWEKKKVGARNSVALWKTD